MEGLVLSDRFAYKQNNSNQEVFNYKQEVFTSTGQNDNTASLNYAKGSSLLNDVMLNLNRTFGEKHSVLGTIVFSTEKTKGSYVSAYRSGLPFSSVPSLNLGTTESATNDGGFSDDTRVGLVGRLGYTIKSMLCRHLSDVMHRRVLRLKKDGQHFLRFPSPGILTRNLSWNKYLSLQAQS